MAMLVCAQPAVGAHAAAQDQLGHQHRTGQARVDAAPREQGSSGHSGMLRFACESRLTGWALQRALPASSTYHAELPLNLCLRDAADPCSRCPRPAV